ncbi:Mannose-1-phosphate guanylyltransferase [Gemmata obscuriglobus]|uniref:mannose-1-phosphate guanylyltransferase n=1 Tax=Gemmata obscuriglobus TaxID=114 RepID=A0A2Z3H9K8_9BACT|nr:sugar phosphate nucleotidyltransferase [Gemmata obscuriglobus]AWM38364.1 mannose-1-phosphate guanylyltransferase [Gemmata obscuriglobus]QEG28719.1 Mannose-1-phosphate guanylyltransferase [Gemmata obscuriglobus]VTS07001.1 mannose-1-phosphate guanylyltransferase : Mannose-1-phosphate guanylyltransferase OS=Rhodopirellula europaea SH398 GN=RESH_00048 PE=4 SV=1: NTP_transferase: MannoseP_isomer [Gemmata obscuriglobus UQM 2246]
MLHAMIMAGGGGTRFWPRSRSKRPKQFLTFSGNRTLLQSTVDRVSAQIPPERTWVVTGAQYADETAAQLPELPRDHIIGEPEGRDTAPCVGLGAAIIAKADPNATIAVMPADHVIEPEQEFRRALHAAEQFLADEPNKLITFGIRPTFPSTGYGYIKRGAAAGTRQGVTASQVEVFREKPEFSVAEQYVASGEYDWNSGIFVWKPGAILGELKARKPDIHAVVAKIAEAWGAPEFDAVFRGTYNQAEKKSIDYAVMQDAAKEGKVLVLAAPYTWDDVGSWLALERRNPQDANHNTVQANHCGIDTNKCVIVGEPKTVIATYGVSNLLVIQDGDAILVADRKHEDKVKEIVDALKKSNRGEFT